jgi:carboxypeptidase D
MTWAGAQGFHTPIPTSNFLVDGISLPVGNTHTERGLTYYEVSLSGHMVPQFSPWSAFQSMQYLLGQRSTP